MIQIVVLISLLELGVADMDGFKKSAKMSYVGHYICGGKVMKKAKGGIARGEEPMVEQEDIDYVSRQSEKSKKDMGLPVSVYTKGKYDSEASKNMMENNRKEGKNQRFEDFIKKREETLQHILDHAVKRGFPLKVIGDHRQEAISMLNASIAPEHSPTFRRGKIGGWREEFSPENISIFKKVAGDLLIHLGYEKNFDW